LLAVSKMHNSIADGRMITVELLGKEIVGSGQTFGLISMIANQPNVEPRVSNDHKITYKSATGKTISVNRPSSSHNLAKTQLIGSGLYSDNHNISHKSTNIESKSRVSGGLYSDIIDPSRHKISKLFSKKKRSSAFGMAVMSALKDRKQI
jgi:hypothetical protein